MLSPVASTSSAPEPKMYSATYVENYLDTVENLPNTVARILTCIREVDLRFQGRFIFGVLREAMSMLLLLFM